LYEVFVRKAPNINKHNNLTEKQNFMKKSTLCLLASVVSAASIFGSTIWRLLLQGAASMALIEIKP
ncbi:MAG: hypothetical protein J6W69_03635, partial [Bacteroidales bacterium]|nr:hypothetical protein [Bacteroidales bacterium]